MKYQDLLTVGDVVIYEGKPFLVMSVNECRAYIKSLAKTKVKVGDSEFEAASGTYNISPHSHVPVLETDEELELAMAGEYGKERKQAKKAQTVIVKQEEPDVRVRILKTGVKSFDSVYCGLDGFCRAADMKMFMFPVRLDDGSTVKVFIDEVEVTDEQV